MPFSAHSGEGAEIAFNGIGNAIHSNFIMVNGVWRKSANIKNVGRIAPVEGGVGYFNRVYKKRIGCQLNFYFRSLCSADV